MSTNTLCVTVLDAAGQEHKFFSQGLHEEFSYTFNDYTGELTVERVEYGPRGTDEWARIEAVVVAAWPTGAWRSVTRHNPTTA